VLQDKTISVGHVEFNNVQPTLLDLELVLRVVCAESPEYLLLLRPGKLLFSGLNSHAGIFNSI